MGEERATTLMAMISPTGWADVATKQDLAHQTVLLRTELQYEVALLRAEFQQEAALLRAELQQEGALLRAEMAQFVTKADFEKGLRLHSLATATFTSVAMGIAVTLARAV